MKRPQVFKKCFLMTSKKEHKTKTYPAACPLGLFNIFLLCSKIIPNPGLGYWIKYLYRIKTTENPNYCKRKGTQFTQNHKILAIISASFSPLQMLEQKKSTKLNYKQGGKT